MKEGWEYKTLGEICDLYQPKTISTKEMVSDGLYDVFGANGKIGKYHSYNHEHSEILMTCRGATCGNINISTPKSWINGNAMVVHIKDEGMLDRQFLVYSLIHIDKAHIITGAAQPQITRQTLSPLQVCFPSLSEQQSIVDYLDSAFAKIDAMKANAEKALHEAKALFQASLKEMLEPKEGWEEKALKDFATDMYRGSGVKRDQVTEEGMSCVRYGEIYTKYDYHFNECDSHTLEEYVSSPKYFEHGDILFAITGESVEEIGKSIAYTGKEKCIAGGDIVVMKHNYEPRYISYALSTPSAIKQKGRGKTKLKVVHTNIPSLKEIIIPIAPEDEQIKIADTLDSLKSKVDRLQENYIKISQECDALKQAILRQVFE